MNQQIKMQKTVVKNLTIISLLLIYINRGLFVFGAYEIKYQGGGEVNSVIELFMQFITGEGNDIDEDGDLPTDYNHVNIVHYDFSQQFAQNLELANLFSKDREKTAFPNKENLPIKDFCVQIDQPPEMIV